MLLDQAQARLPGLDAQLAAARQDLALRVVQAYLSALLAQDTLASTRSQRETLEAQLHQAQRTFDIGTGTLTDLSDAQARYDLIIATELQNAVNLTLAMQALSVLPGVTPVSLEPVNVEAPLSALEGKDLQSWVAAADRQSYPVLEAQATAQGQHLEIDHARTAWKPTVDLTLNLSQQHFSQSDLNLTDTGGRTAEIGVQLTVPIWEAGLRDSKLRQAVAQAEQADQELQVSRRAANLAIRQAFTTLGSSAAQVTALKQAVHSSQVSVDASTRGKEIGSRTLVDVLNARQQLFQANNLLVGARYGSVLALFQLKAAAGTLDEADLQALSGDVAGR